MVSRLPGAKWVTSTSSKPSDSSSFRYLQDLASRFLAAKLVTSTGSNKVISALSDI